MKLNLGCGFKKREGYVNVDASEGCNPDVVLDLAKKKWPWETSAVQEVVFEFSLEQMGQTANDLQHVFSELYRVCAGDAKIFVIGFHPRHDQFFLNPLCVHRLSPEFFQLLSVQRNLGQIANGDSDNCVGMQWGVNFNVTRHKYLVSQVFQEEMQSGKITEQDLRQRIVFQNNVCHAYEVDLSVTK